MKFHQLVSAIVLTSTALSMSASASLSDVFGGLHDTGCGIIRVAKGVALLPVEGVCNFTKKHPYIATAAAIITTAYCSNLAYNYSFPQHLSLSQPESTSVFDFLVQTKWIKDGGYQFPLPQNEKICIWNAPGMSLENGGKTLMKVTKGICTSDGSNFIMDKISEFYKDLSNDVPYDAYSRRARQLVKSLGDHTLFIQETAAYLSRNLSQVVAAAPAMSTALTIVPQAAPGLESILRGPVGTNF